MTTITWLPLNEYAMRSGTSISTLRRKIKTNAIEFKMEEGRYLIRGDDLAFNEPKTTPFVSTDAAPAKAFVKERPPTEIFEEAPSAKSEEVSKLKIQLDDTALRLRALDARVNGLVKKIEFFLEENAELKMLVKLFEEKLDKRG